MAFTTAKLTTIAAAVAFPVALLSAVARADELAAPDMPTTEKSAPHAIDRAWLYLDDAKGRAPMTAIGTMSVAYTSVGTNPDPTSEPYRAFAGNTAQAGALATLGAEVGILPRVSLEALGQMQLGGEGPGVNPGAVAGARFQLSPPSWTAVHLTASAGYLRETWSTPADPADAKNAGGGAHGAWASVAAAFDIQRLRLGVTAFGEHVFAPGRDGVDVMLQPARATAS
jgi:hypothetical protein